MIIEYFGHPLCMFINKSNKSGSSVALHPPEKKEEEETKVSKPTILLEQKKGPRGRMEKPKSNTNQKDIHPSHTHAHDQVLNVT